MASALFEVTASALNLRTQPDRQASVLAVLLRGRTCVATGDVTNGWLPVVFEGRHGFLSAAFVRALGQSVAVSPPSGLMVAVDVTRKERDLAQLHPQMRERVEQLVQQTEAAGLTFRIYEAFRTPERQQWLFAQGRTRMDGGIVTKARAWESFHQFGLGVDLVLFGSGGWSWDDSGARAAEWKRMRELAVQVGLRTLKWELPHAELPVSLADWNGGSLIASGDATWRDNLAVAAERWRRAGGTGAPALVEAERPALPAEAL